MKVGVIFHSSTGNTERVVGKIKECLDNKGHTVDLIKLQFEKNAKGEIAFNNSPILKDYDTIIFGSHVEAFSLEGVIKAYLGEIEMINGKKVICFLSQGLPYSWMGAKKSLKQMQNLVKAKGVNVIATESISFSKKSKPDDMTLEVVKRICDKI